METESWMWHNVSVSYRSDIWPNGTRRGCDSCDNKQRMKMVGRERRNVRECTGGGVTVREKDEEKQSANH